MRIESVGCEVSSVCFVLLIWVKTTTIAIQRGQTNTTLMTIGGTRIVHSKLRIIIALLSYTPIKISHVR